MPVRHLLAAHPFRARDMQAPPPDLMRTWLLSGGHSAGKTRAGAEWVRRAALQAGYRRGALVGPTFSDVREVLATTGTAVPLRLVHARLSKRGRAGPVAAFYQQGRVAHAGTVVLLEDQLCRFGTEEQAGSPDRVGALVWGIGALLIDGRGPRVRAIS